MSQQPIANNADYPLMSSARVNRKSSSHQPKTAEEQPLPRLANDSFETEHTPKKTKLASPKPTIEKQGVPLINTALIALVSLGVGSGVMLLGAKQFNWFELGKKVETKTVKELPEALNKLLNVNGAPLTEEQAIKAVEKLQQRLAKGATDLAEAHKTIAKKDKSIVDLQGQLATKINEWQTAKDALAAKHAELVEATRKLDVLLTVPDDKGNFMDNFVGKDQLRNQIKLLEADKADFAQKLVAAQKNVESIQQTLEKTIEANLQEIADLKKSHGEAVTILKTANAQMQAKAKAAGYDVFDGSPIKLIDLDKPLKDELGRVTQQLEWAIQQHEEYQQVIKELGEHQEQLLNMPQADTSLIIQRYEDHIQDLVIQYERDLHDARQGNSTVQPQNKVSQHTSQLALPSLATKQNTAGRTVQTFPLADTTDRQIGAPVTMSHQPTRTSPNVLPSSESKIEPTQDYPHTPFSQRLTKFVEQGNPKSPTSSLPDSLDLGVNKVNELPWLEAPSSLPNATPLGLPSVSVSSNAFSFNLNEKNPPVAKFSPSVELPRIEASSSLPDTDRETRQWLDELDSLTDDEEISLNEWINGEDGFPDKTNVVLEQSVENSNNSLPDKPIALAPSANKKIHFSSLAFEELEALAIGGNPEAQAELGSRYFLEENYEMSFQCYEEAAHKNIAKAQHKLGFFYENGIGVKQNQEQANDWYERAHQNGY